MASQLKIIEPVQTALTLMAPPHAVILKDSEQFNAWYEKLSADRPVEQDMATTKGRDTIRSYAAKVRSEKAGIDKTRLALTAEARDMVAQVNAQGKVIGETLESLAVEIRAPLTAWEEAEKARIADCEARIAAIKAAAIVTEDDTANTVKTRGQIIWADEFNAAHFGDLLGQANDAKETAIATLKAALARLTKEEADAAELAALRAANAEREAAEAQKRADEQAKRDADEAARIASERKAAAEKADAERLRIATEKAAQDARDDADRKAAADLKAKEDAHAAELKAAKDKADAELKAVRDAADAAERVSKAVAHAAEQKALKEAADIKMLADAQAELDKNKAHRTKVRREAKEAIMSCGADEETAKKIVLAIQAGEVPRVSLVFTA